MLRVGFTKLSRSLEILVSSCLTFSPLPRGIGALPTLPRDVFSSTSPRHQFASLHLFHRAVSFLWHFPYPVKQALPPLHRAVRVTDHPVLWSSDFPLPRLPSPGGQRGATLSSPSPPPFSFSCSTLLRIASLAKRSASLFCSLGTDSILKDENPRRSSIAAR